MLQKSTRSTEGLRHTGKCVIVFSGRCSTPLTSPNRFVKSSVLITSASACLPVTSLGCRKEPSASCCQSLNTGTNWQRKDASHIDACINGFVMAATLQFSRLMHPRKVSLWNYTQKCNRLGFTIGQLNLSCHLIHTFHSWHCSFLTDDASGLVKSMDNEYLTLLM